MSCLYIVVLFFITTVESDPKPVNTACYMCIITEWERLWQKSEASIGLFEGEARQKRLCLRAYCLTKVRGSIIQRSTFTPLPEFRNKEVSAFTHTGVDFAGLLSVRGLSGSIKMWTCTFTCLVTRAVHLSTVCDQHTDTFIRCLKHFASSPGHQLRT